MVLTVEGRLTAWSFTDAPVPTDAAQPDTYVVRMAGARGSEEWPFWLEVEDGTRVRARLAVVMPLPTLLPGMTQGMWAKASGAACACSGAAGT